MTQTDSLHPADSGREEFIPRDPAYAQRVREAFAAQHFMAYIGAELALVAPGRVAVQVGHAPHLMQNNGYFHGGVIATLADDAGGLAAWSLLEPQQEVLTVEFKVNIVAPGQGDALIARAKVVKPGRRLIISGVEVYGVGKGKETLVATQLMTLLVVEPGR